MTFDIVLNKKKPLLNEYREPLGRRAANRPEDAGIIRDESSYGNRSIMLVSERIQQFIDREGRRPRVLVSNLGKKSHDQYCRFLSTFFAENGFDVDLSPLRQTPRGTARMAIENDVHFICFLSTENKHEHLVAGLIKALRSEQGESIRIIIGGFIPRSDYHLLYSAGASLILNSGPPDQTAIHRILDLLE